MKMKKFGIFLIMLAVLFPSSVLAENFLEAPVLPGGKVLVKTDARLEFVVPKGHNEVLDYYRNALKKFKDIRIREWKDSTYIEDDGALPWHSITISKDAQPETTIVIVKDNWTWILGTLILRFVGVFIVLLILFLAMGISGSLISRAVGRSGEKKASA